MTLAHYFKKLSFELNKSFCVCLSNFIKRGSGLKEEVKKKKIISHRSSILAYMTSCFWCVILVFKIFIRHEMISHIS